MALGQRITHHLQASPRTVLPSMRRLLHSCGGHDQEEQDFLLLNCSHQASRHTLYETGTNIIVGRCSFAKRCLPKLLLPLNVTLCNAGYSIFIAAGLVSCPLPRGPTFAGCQRRSPPRTPLQMALGFYGPNKRREGWGRGRDLPVPSL